VAEVIETRLSGRSTGHGHADRRGQRVLAEDLGIVLVGNIIALMLLLVPGVNIVAFFLVNGYLLGREFFEFAAMRLFAGRGAAVSLTPFRHGLRSRSGDFRLPGDPRSSIC
jgi:uncharacterized protein involved in cysteine biosynthesis